MVDLVKHNISIINEKDCLFHICTRLINYTLHVSQAYMKSMFAYILEKLYIYVYTVLTYTTVCVCWPGMYEVHSDISNVVFKTLFVSTTNTITEIIQKDN